MTEAFAMSEKEQTIIDVQGLTAGYGDDVIVEDISFKVRQGDIFVILGGSGCGKSTVMKNMIGLIEPFSGKVFIGGDDIVQAEGPDKRMILRKIGVMYQSGALFGSMTVGENLRLVMEEFSDLPLEVMERICRIKLGIVGLAGTEDKLPSELSGGMIKRAAIARAMVMDPDIIFLDEPGAGLDPITSAGLDQLILSLSRNLKITFIIVSHELASIYAIADNSIMLDKDSKGIVARGKPVELRDNSDNPLVKNFFNRTVDNNKNDLVKGG